MDDDNSDNCGHDDDNGNSCEDGVDKKKLERPTSLSFYNIITFPLIR